MNFSALRLLVLCVAVISASFAADVAGSSDYPGIGRFVGSEIKTYRVENYGETVLATGPVKSAADAETTSLRVEGKITRILYRIPPGFSTLEVFRNFEARIDTEGYEKVFSGGPGEIRAYEFKYKHPVEILEEISVSDEIRYLAAKRTVGGAQVHLSVLVSPHSGGDGLRARLIACEAKAMEMQMLDADKMQRDIGETGRVALYGVYFDPDEAVIKPESKPTLDEIAKLLGAEPSLGLIVVGHTDITGSFDHNIDLSRRRAEAVVEALVTDYGIAQDRLHGEGVGYLAPAASNDSEEGRALNRRVVLVKEK